MKLKLEIQLYFLRLPLKNNLMRSLFLILLIGVSNILFSQINVSQNKDLSNFPLIEFTINNRNPNILPSSAFSFNELIDGKKVKNDDFKIKQLNDSIDYSDKNKCVLILLEILSHPERKEQNLTFKKALLESLDSIVNKGDKFKIVAFSLKDDETKILKNINNNFTDNVSLIKKALELYEQEENDFTNKVVSDIYGAIIEGVKELDDFESNLSKSILLLSEERNNSKIINSGTNAINLAKEKGIIINTIKYNRFLYHQFADPTIAQNTYGNNFVLSKSSGKLKIVNQNKKEEVKAFLKSILNNIVKRSYGINYSVSLTLKNKIRNGKNYIIDIKVDDTNEIQKINYKAPGNWIIAQFELNFYLASTVLFILLLIFGYTIRYFFKKNKLKEIENKNRLVEQKEKEAQQESFIKQQQEELLNIKNQENQRIKIEEEENRKQIEKKLITQMQSKGSFPILKFSDTKGSKQFEINNPIMTIGRDNASNRICIPNNNVSRNHFSIIFLNNEYRIKDNNSTNGIILNGNIVKESVLKNGDIIEIADLSFTFYE